jgi:cytochrome c553
MSKLMFTFGLALAVTCSTGAWAQPTVATQPVQESERAALFPDKNRLQQGRNIADANCARCHGLDGISQEENRPNLAGQRAVYLYRVLQAYQNGYRIDQSMGHAGGFLNDEGLLSVAAYYANLPPVTVTPPADPSASELDLAADPFESIRDDLKKCNKCHGEDGNSSASGMPNLTAQDPAYFESAMQAYADGARQHKMMTRLVGNLDEQTISAMGIYYAVQEPQRTEKQGDGDEAAGRVLAEECVNCHGEDGNATGADMPTLAGQDPKYFVKAMNAYREGERQHEAMAKAADGLSEEDLNNLATFYAARAPAKRSVRVPFTAAEWIDRCERCHGIDGNSTDPRFPMLAGQNPGYLERAFQAYSDNGRNNSTMHAMSAPLNDSDIRSIVRYYSTRQPKSIIYAQLPCEEPE